MNLTRALTAVKNTTTIGIIPVVNPTKTSAAVLNTCINASAPATKASIFYPFSTELLFFSLTILLINASTAILAAS